MSEVVRLAAEMQHREETNKMEKSATVAAAEEVGISEEYLEKAAQELQIQRIAKAQARRRRNAAAGAIVGLAALTLGIGFLAQPPAPMTLATAATIERVSEGTLASVTPISANSVTLAVDKFQQSANGDYYANAAVPLTSLARYKNVTFNVKGSGFRYIRVDIEGSDFRWKSDNIPVSPDGKQVTLSLREFQRQQRVDNTWKNVRYKSPRSVERFTIKTGETINAPDVTGTVTVSDITFK